MSCISLTGHQVEAITSLLTEHDASDVDIFDDTHSAVVVTIWGQVDENLQPDLGEYPLLARVSISVGGTVRDQLGAAA